MLLFLIFIFAVYAELHHFDLLVEDVKVLMG